MYYLETHSTDPTYNLALEETMLLRRTEGELLMLWQNDRSVIIGRNQNTPEEIDGAYAAGHGVAVVRRITGGGAVYHDLGNLNYSFLTDAEEQLSARRFTEPVVAALRALGLDAEASGRNDILVSGRKVSGTAQRLWNGRILHHGTLLFDADAEEAARVLRPASDKFQSKSTKSVRSRIGNIRPLLSHDMTLDEFWQYLKTALAGELTPTEPTAEEQAQALALQREKYGTWEWNCGAAPASTASCRRRYPGGALEVSVRLEQGRIRHIDFRGDFLALRDLAPVAKALEGRPCRRDEAAAVLSRFAPEEYFGSLTAEEILDTIPYAEEC